MVNYACAFSQSEMEKYFELAINAINEFGFRRIWRIKQIKEGVIGRGG